MTRPEGSEMWDSMAIDYPYPGGRTISLMCRQIPGTQGDNNNVIYGSKGIANIGALSGGSRIVDRDGNQIWSMKRSISNAYQQEHKYLVDSIHQFHSSSRQPIVELRQTRMALNPQQGLIRPRFSVD